MWAGIRFDNIDSDAEKGYNRYVWWSQDLTMARSRAPSPRSSTAKYRTSIDNSSEEPLAEVVRSKLQIRVQMMA